MNCSVIDERSFAAHGVALSEVRATVNEAARKVGLDEPDCYDLTLAANEAVTNAVEHGSEPGDEVRLLVAGGRDRVTVEIRDGGRFIPNLDLEAQGIPHRGRGLTLIAHLVDEVCVQSGEAGTRLRLSKQLAA